VCNQTFLQYGGDLGQVYLQQFIQVRIIKKIFGQRKMQEGKAAILPGDR
jgi:hypothetical protein